MTNDNAGNVDRVWELMNKIGFAMLVTRDGDRLRARPMSAYLERDGNRARSFRQSVVRRRGQPEICIGDGHGHRHRRPREDQAAVFDPGQSLVEQCGRSEHPRPESHA